MGLAANDLKFLVDNIIEIDSYKSKMGHDSDIITMALSVNSESPAKDLENFLEKGYPFVLDADVSSGEQSDGTYKVFVEIERNADAPQQILEIADGIKKLASLENLRFRYYKNFRSFSLDEENITNILPTDSDSYEFKIKETFNENYKNFFSNSYAESIDMIDDQLIIKNTYAEPLRFQMLDFDSKENIQDTMTESFNINAYPEILFLTKYIGDYNISKYGDKLVFENEDKTLILKRL